MRRTLYIALIWLHPAAFRRQFGEELLWIFDEAATTEATGMLLDLLVSILRQWLFRSGLWKVALAFSGAFLEIMCVGMGWFLMSQNVRRAPAPQAPWRPDPRLNDLAPIALWLPGIIALTTFTLVRWPANFNRRRVRGKEPRWLTKA